MITDLNRTVAYRCPVCGEISFASVSLFELCSNKGVAMHCSCGKSTLVIETENRNSFFLSVDCVFCNKIHRFPFSFKEISYKKCRKFTCPECTFDLGVAFIGRLDETAAMIEEDELCIREMAAELNLETAGKNAVFLLKAIEKIRNVATEGDIHCTCGSVYIDVDVSPAALFLVCEKCGNIKTIPIDVIKTRQFSEMNSFVLDTPPKKE